jgi:hypothetical protein
MKKLIAATLLIITIFYIQDFSLAVFAQSSGPPTQPAQSPKVNSIELIIASDMENYELNPIFVHITLKNIGKQPINIAVDQPIYPQIKSISVIGPDKNPAPLTRAGKYHKWPYRGSIIGFMLKPEESFEAGDIPISHYYDMTLPGTYWIKIATLWGTATCKVIVQD